jgi:hypothetical protein
MWALLLYTSKLEYFRTFKFIEENMIWGFDDNFHGEAKLT